jgi:GNAT superfamily N-acetyltransferase
MCLKIYQTNEKDRFWKIFRKHHYLSGNHNNSAKVFVGTLNGELCAFQSVLHFPNRIVKNFKISHRLVVLPDYQGIGVGSAFSTAIAKMYIDNGFRYLETTSSPALIASRKKNPDWICSSYGRGRKQTKKKKGMHDSTFRMISSWEYKPRGVQNDY